MEEFVEIYKNKFVSSSVNFDVFEEAHKFLIEKRKERPDVSSMKFANQNLYQPLLCENCNYIEFVFYQSETAFKLKFEASYPKETELETKLKLVKRIEELSVDQFIRLKREIHRKSDSGFSRKVSFKQNLLSSSFIVMNHAKVYFQIKQKETGVALIGELIFRPTKLSSLKQSNS